MEASAAQKVAGWGHAVLAALTVGSPFSVSRGAAYPRRDAKPDPCPPRGLVAAQQTRWEVEAAGLAEAERRGLVEMAAAARVQAPRLAPVGHGFPYSGPGAGFLMLFGLHLGAA